MISELGMKPETVHRYLSDIRAVINYAIEPIQQAGSEDGAACQRCAQPVLPGVAEQERVRVLTHASDASSGYGVCWKGLGAV
ncbi:hypothetical protein CWR43_24510 [Rhizobium sullae]|uniref:Uncharacterized protein n=1 Tax=Rhizobium sullae TaxID=50338 RepID=A0A2N0D439_RHISU|nr:hypothetical protein CWR43_24510 [Rhizobium sullae]